MENGRHGNLAVASAAIAIPDPATPVVQLGNKAKGIYQLAFGYVQYASSMSEVANKGASTLFTAAAEPEVPEETRTPKSLSQSENYVFKNAIKII